MSQNGIAIRLVTGVLKWPHCHTAGGETERSVLEDVRQHLSPQEYECLMQTNAASDYEDLSLFAR